MIYCNQYHNKEIHYISHIILSHPIALFHHSHLAFTADPHGSCEPGATMVVLCKGLISILASVVRKPRLATTHM